LGINVQREIVGFYDDPTVGRQRAFVLSKGVFTPIDVSGSKLTGALGINKHGDIVGFYLDGSTLQARNFVLSKGIFTPIDMPEHFGAVGATAYGINTAGQIVRVYAHADGTQHGFLATPAKK
jgi:uncharacterized membrane protein